MNAQKISTDGVCAQSGVLRIIIVLVPLILIALISVSPLIGSLGAASTPINYYFPYYDNDQSAGADQYASIIIENLGSGDATVEVNMSGYGSIPCGTVSPGTPASISAPVEGGLLRVTSVSGQPLLVSQLVQYGEDIEQIYALEESDPDTQVFFTWYDQSLPGWNSQIAIANAGSADTWVDVYVDGVFRSGGAISPGGFLSTSFPGVTGPVKVVSNNGQPVIASMRITNDGGFTEVPGIPLHELTDHYFWTLYDSVSQSAWLIISNPNQQPVYYEVKIGGTVETSSTIDAGNVYYASYPALKDGPAEIQAWSDSGHTTPANVITSLRELRGSTLSGKFQEEPGTPASQLDSSVDLAWHDEAVGTAFDTSLHIANAGSAVAEVYVDIESSASSASLQIPPNSVANPSFPEANGGAVRISSANGQPIIAREIITPQLNEPANAHYFTWYDNLYGLTWVMMANPVAGSENSFDHFLGNQQLNSAPLMVGPGQALPERYDSRFGGPLKVVTGNSGDTLISERSLFGNSFEEIWATPYSELDSYYRWPWYDGYNSNEWIMVANPPENNENILAIVTLYNWDPVANTTHEFEQTRVLAPGESWPCSFEGYIADSVTVNAYSEAGTRGNPDDARKVIASRRALYNGAFNEMPGIPSRNFSSTWGWPWYDNQSAGSSSWIIVNNPGTQPSNVYVMLMIGDSFATVLPDALVPQQSWAIYVPDIMDGPAVVYGCWDVNNCLDTPAPIVATQRSIWGNSFSEIAGERDTGIKSSNAHWTWYDEKSPGSVNYVMISNLEDVPVYYETRLAGLQIGSGIIDPHSSATPDYRDKMDGPLQVDAWISETDGGGNQLRLTGADIMASQRVLWNGYFNEIFGKTL
ncbi:MAG: hypothetical protein ACYC6O_01195 [Thermoleophilia bacterium]